MRLAETHKFDLLLSDYLMPGMNGVELITKMRQQCTKLPCFLYSGLTDLPDNSTVADKFFSKLDGIEMLLSEIKMKLDSQRQLALHSQKD